MSSKLFRGTLILSLGTYISKFLGLFYVIPFYALIGGEDNAALFSYGYTPYTIFLSIATAGVPLAVSKFISKYNTLGEYEVGRKLFKSGLLVMVLTGIASFIVMYAFAPYFADITIAYNDEQKVKVEDVTTVIRAVSFALLIIPFMSLIRGFFQGHQSMGPSAVSQVVEQIVRIVFLLAGVFFVLKVMNGSLTTAIALATFAAFVGGVASLAVLMWYWIKRKPKLDALPSKSPGTLTISYRDMYKEILVYSVPFVFVGLANPLFQVIDQFTVNKAMGAIGLAADADRFFGILNFSSHKLVIIPVSLATAFSMTLIPLVTESFVKGSRTELKHQIDQTFQVLMYLTIPAAIGISILAEPAYTIFYDHSIDGTMVLRAYAPVAILFALFAVTAAILQGINEQKYTILSLLIGLLVKLVLNIPLIEKFQIYGAIIATTLGYLIAIIINLFVIKHYAKYNFKMVSRRVMLMGIFNIVMAIVVWIVYTLLQLLLNPANTLSAVVIVTICGTIGASLYFYLGFRSYLIDKLFGDRAIKLRRKLGLGS
ncbi:polysaccharide biosynthesis protein [Bacillus spongiae]|uniref:Polysaccharide biosynthesis protein n=1 Tax=Bacillus spongiae TaxID=2683610 RepID=A0ABU8HI58_9BACI